MKILMLSWRDIKNPKAGGAEVVTYELLRRWAKKGHDCTWFSSAFKGSLQHQSIDGINVIRKGSPLGVYWQGFRYLKNNKFDIVIDQINTIPFFTPLFYKGRKIAFFHQLCEKVWFYETIFPISYIGYFAEKVYLKLYRDVPSIVVSDSTKKSLENYRFKDIFVMQDCIDTEPLKELPVKKENLLIFVGRLKKSKRVHDAIEAFRLVHKKIPSSVLHIVGRGDKGYEKYLKKLSTDLPVVFHGFVSREKRNDLMKDAEAILVTSVKEGWGLIVVEANAFGTPAIVYDVDGLRDSVKNNRTGLIAARNTPKALSDSAIEFLLGTQLKKKLSSNALVYSKLFGWEESSDEVLEFVESVLRGKN